MISDRFLVPETIVDPSPHEKWALSRTTMESSTIFHTTATYSFRWSGWREQLGQLADVGQAIRKSAKGALFLPLPGPFPWQRTCDIPSYGDGRSLQGRGTEPVWILQRSRDEDRTEHFGLSDSG